MFDKGFGFDSVYTAAAWLDCIRRLPNQCFALCPSDPTKVIMIYKLVLGYSVPPAGLNVTPENYDLANVGLGVTPEQCKAMMTGSMMGWDSPGIDPSAYGEKK